MRLESRAMIIVNCIVWQLLAIVATVFANSEACEPKFVWSDKYNVWLLRKASCDKTSSFHSNRKQDEDQDEDEDEEGKGKEKDEPKAIWPNDANAQNTDRIIEQIKLKVKPLPNRAFKIVPSEFGLSSEQAFSECAVSNCVISYNKSDADLIVWQNADVEEGAVSPQKRRQQVWVALLLESPLNTFASAKSGRFLRARDKSLKSGSTRFDWIASYRPDSHLVTPYARFVPFEQSADAYFAMLQEPRKRPTLTSALASASALALSAAESVQELPEKAVVGAPNATQVADITTTPANASTLAPKVAAFVSNCNALNQRLEFARELAKYVNVDVFGACGDKQCSKADDASCMRMLKEKGYNFYLAFENSNCRFYITEKLFKNSFGYNSGNSNSNNKALQTETNNTLESARLVPIVLGAPKRDYQAVAPRASFVHVADFGNARQLAAYLRLLVANKPQFEAYFRWRQMGEFVDTKFYCRLCALLNYHHLRINNNTANARQTMKASCKESNERANSKPSAKEPGYDLPQWWLQYPSGKQACFEP